MIERTESVEENRDTDRDWYVVGLSVPWVVRGVDSTHDAINIAVAEVGKRTEDASRIGRMDINLQQIPCADPDCGTITDAVLLVADMAMVALQIKVEVQAESENDARRVAKNALGKHLKDVPVKAVTVARTNIST